MTAIEFTKDEREILTRNIQIYFREELSQDIGLFDAGFLLDFISKEIGVYFYNRGLYDAQTILESKLEDLGEAIYQLEKPTDFRR